MTCNPCGPYCLASSLSMGYSRGRARTTSPERHEQRFPHAADQFLIACCLPLFQPPAPQQKRRRTPKHRRTVIRNCPAASWETAAHDVLATCASPAAMNIPCSTKLAKQYGPQGLQVIGSIFNMIRRPDFDAPVIARYKPIFRITEKSMETSRIYPGVCRSGTARSGVVSL